MPNSIRWLLCRLMRNGISRFETGLGDLLVWASDKDLFNYRKIAVGETDTLKLVLDKQPGGSYNVEYDLDVPLALIPLPGPSQALADENSKKLSAENEIRRKYIDSWMKPEEARVIGFQAECRYGKGNENYWHEVWVTTGR